MRFALVLVLLAGCFSPHYVDGGFSCTNPTGCPSEQRCSTVDHRCYFPDHLPLGPTSDGAVTPDAEAGATMLHAEGDTCDPLNAGTPQRSDNCASGLVCVDGNLGSRCMRVCTAGSQCGGTACEQRPVEVGGPLVYVCGSAPVTCVPVAPQSGCLPDQVCYLRGTDTVCETSSGDGRLTSCSYSRDCLPGYTCSTGQGIGYCRQVCSHTVGCSFGTVCQIGETESYGYCL